MKYLLLIYGDEEASSAEEYTASVKTDDLMERYNEFGRKAQARGLELTGNALESVKAATTVRVRKDEVLVTDGPFAETKEQLGGYYLVDCKDIDEAIEVASWIPGASTGSVEVRPIMEFS